MILALIPLFPLAGFLVSAILRPPKKLLAILAPGVILASFIVSVLAFVSLTPPQILKGFTWLPLKEYKITFGLLYDELSSVALLFITGVSFLVHVYSVGYMWEDKGFKRYFALLNLFVFFMIMLVMSQNLFEMFLGWEGVGLCSYLLIGFWYDDILNAKAGLKAFIVNRIGDLGFVLGVIGLLVTFGTLDFYELANIEINEWVRVLGILLFCGAIGKSAQGPLWLWLPDAMRGPTPVSALIHAATMVTAGVYMVGRMHFLFLEDEFLRNFVFAFGAITMLFTGLFGIFENDMKRILAFSTLSQLGMMFCGVVSKVWMGIFHMFEHSFFKALLFLAVGNVMHFTHKLIDVRKLRGLGEVLKVSGAGFLIGACAMSGIPPFSGFFSKGAIFEGVHDKFGLAGWIVMLAGSFLTVLYIFRVWLLVFWSGKSFKESKKTLVEREGGYVMTLAVAILAILSIVGGIFPVGEWMGDKWGFEGFRIGVGEIPIIITVVLALLSSWAFWGKGKEILEGTKVRMVFERKLYLNEAEEWTFTGFGVGLSKFIWKVVETVIIEGIYGFFAELARSAGSAIRQLHGGEAGRLIVVMSVGIAIIIAIATWLWY